MDIDPLNTLRILEPQEIKKINTEQKNKNKNKVSVVFLDRDGVINKENGGVNSISKFKILPKVGNAIKILIIRIYPYSLFLIKLCWRKENEFK